MGAANGLVGGEPFGMTGRPEDDPRSTPIMLRRELIAAGWKDEALARMVRSRAWAKPRYGAYVDGSAWRATDDVGRHEITARAVLKRANTELVLSHLTGAVVWDLSFWDLPLPSVHGTRPDGRCGRAEAGVVQHRGALLEQDVTTRHGLPVVSATRLGLELSSVTDVEHALSFVNELLHRGHTTQPELWDRYASMTRWPHSLNTEVVLRLSTPKLESPGEHRTSYLLFRQGFPKPEYQYDILTPGGVLVARVDFAWPELGVWIEFDGRIKYTRNRRPGQSIDDVVLEEKKREEMIEELTGWVCVRITWADLYHPEQVALRIRRAMDRARRRRIA